MEWGGAVFLYGVYGAVVRHVGGQRVGGCCGYCSFHYLKQTIKYLIPLHFITLFFYYSIL